MARCIGPPPMATSPGSQSASFSNNRECQIHARGDDVIDTYRGEWSLIAFGVAHPSPWGMRCFDRSHQSRYWNPPWPGEREGGQRKSKSAKEC
eukprot:4832383-Heterocapsa_arctica.AAC.1